MVGVTTSAYKICLSGYPNSCLIKIEKQRFRALVDSGADISLMKRDVYDSLKISQNLSDKTQMFSLSMVTLLLFTAIFL